ncbi:MAG: hypothetical protein ABL957_01990 [Parvularculaceae bacterium]
MPITFAAAEAAARLPLEHRDPWDRILAGQAIDSRSVLVTKDSCIEKLGIQTIW